MLPKEELVRFDKKYNRKEDIHIVGNKWYAYKKFKDFYSRECCLVEIGKNKSATDDSLDAFSDFISRHNRFMVKPLYKDSGVGISIIEVLENYDVCDIMEKCPNSDFIAEELIMQSDDLARFHPSSVNTLRLNTIRCKDKTEVLWPILRFGRSGNVVDNAHYNGVFAVVDVNTGITIGAGDVKRHKYTEHPDSHVPLVGFQIPQWKEVCDMVKNLATMTDGLRFIGWDLAHTEKGWVLVEANTSPGILSPMVTGKGIKKEFYAIRKRM